MSAREVHITVINVSSFELQLDSKTYLNHGEWILTPTNVPEGGNLNFRADSDGVMTGAEGSIFYTVPDGEIKLYFDDPYVGSNAFAATTSSPSVSVQAVGSSGNVCKVMYVITNK